MRGKEALKKVEEALDAFVSQKMTEAWTDGAARGALDAQSGHTKELKEAEARGEARGRAAVLEGKERAELVKVVFKTLRKVRDDVFDNEDKRAYEAIDDAERELREVLE